MANALGRISGQLLKDNLERDGKPLQFDNDLLYLNTANKYIGINNDTPFRDLFVTGTTKTTNLISVNGLIGVSSLGISISDNNIVSTNDINLVASNYIFANDVRTDNIKLTANDISTTTLNTNLEIRPNGLGSLEIYNNVNVLNNKKLYAQGDITLSGNLTIGNAPSDTVTLLSNVNSDIVPSENNLYSLGSNPLTLDGAKWLGIYPELINGQEITTTSISSGGVNLVSRPGNIWYVSTTGSNINEGDHQSASFATIQHALNQAQPGDEVFVYPGTYTEITPLEIPTGVSLKGTDLRSVKLVPDVTTQSENVILLNGETTVSDITIADFYYDSINDTGYAFSFAPGFTVTTRSPYIQNVSVITKGSVTTVDDPRGFLSGDAGKGALVDGANAVYTSNEASMLFHSCTFITPGVDALTMTNGVRVEWLNSFTYFANIGLYATRGTGRLDKDNVTIRYGAELRSIGSANVYGNYGAYADGEDTLMYLINHNFAYIGAGKDVSNDPSLNIEANETVELDNGKIYYQSLDNKGNFRVGDAFSVSFETGNVQINGVATSASGITSINFADGADETVIDAQQVTVNNIKFSNNTISSLVGPVNLTASTNEINLNSNVDITDNLSIVENFNIDGTLTIGNAFIDIVRFEAPVEFDLRPVTDNDFTLGGPIDKSWDFVYLDTAYIGSYKLENATISTVPIDTDIELRANNTGKIYISTNDVEIDNDLTVSGTTNLGDNVATLAATVTGGLAHTGLLDRTGNTTQTGTYVQDGYLDVSQDVEIVDVLFTDNTVTTLPLDSNLQLGAAGTGKISIPTADVQIDNNLFVTGNIDTLSVEVTTDIVADSYSTADIEISTNIITTTLTDSDLELQAAGTGKIYASQDNVQFAQDLTVDGTTALKTTIITGDITHVGDYYQTGNTIQTGNREITETLDVTNNIYFDNINVVNNRIFTTNLNDSLELRAAGTTGIVIFNDATQFSQNALIGTLESNGVSNSGTVTSDIFTNADIEINDNYITTTVGNNNLIFSANGTGGPRLEKLKFNSSTLSTESGNDSIVFSVPAGNALIDTTTALKVPVGTTLNRPTLSRGEFRFDTTEQLYKGFDTTSITFGGVYSANRLTNVVAHPTNNTLLFTTNSSTAMTISSTGIAMSRLTVDNNLTFSTNTVSPVTINDSIFLSPNGTGSVIIDDWGFKSNEITNQNLTTPLIFQNTGAGYVAFSGTSGLVIPAGDTASQPATPEIGDLRYNTELEVGEIFDGISYRSIAGNVGELISEQESQDISAIINIIFG
jgi:hypothetical protein